MPHTGQVFVHALSVSDQLAHEELVAAVRCVKFCQCKKVNPSSYKKSYIYDIPVIYNSDHVYWKVISKILLGLLGVLSPLNINIISLID